MKQCIVLLAVLAGLAGCATLKTLIGPTLPYTATFCAEGSVPLTCVNLGQREVPTSGIAFVQLVLDIAGPQLVKTTKLKGCVFSTHQPEVTPTKIKVWASAACTLNGVPASEEVSVTLIPMVSA